MKIPYIIKFDNFKVRPLLVQDEFLSYALRVIVLNYDEIKTHRLSAQTEKNFFYRSSDKSEKDKVFMKTLYEQAFLNSVCKVIYAFEEINHLKSLAPKSFEQHFNEIQFHFTRSTYKPDKIRAHFSDAQAKILSGIDYEKENVIKSVYSRYIDIANSVLPLSKSSTEFLPELNEKALFMFCESPDNSYNFDPNIVAYMCSMIGEAFGSILSEYTFGAYHPPGGEQKESEFNRLVFDGIKKTFNINANKSHSLIGHGYSLMSRFESDMVLNLTHKIEPIYWNALNEVYPSLSIQVEKQRLKSFEALKSPTNTNVNAVNPNAISARKTNKI